MFGNKNEGWKRTEQMNKGGPKTKSEVEQEVADKMAKENNDRRDADRRGGGDRRYGNDKYDNRDGYKNNNNRDRRDNRDNRDNRDGGNKKNYNDRGGEQKYVKKNTQDDRNGGQSQRGDNKKGGKREERPPREIVEITDEDMGKLLRKNFETFVATEKYNKHLLEDKDEEEEENKDEPKQEKKPRRQDFGAYKRLAENNGKKEASMLHTFLV